MKQRIYVVVAHPRTDREHIIRRIDVRLRLIQPDVIETIGLYVPVAYFLPEPLRGFRVRGINIRPDVLFVAARIRGSVPVENQPAFAE